MDEGAYLSRYDDSYKPATFSSLRFFQPAMLDTSLLERMIALGCDINDRDIGGSNLIESIIEHFGDRCKVYGSLMSSESASPYLQAIEQLLDLKSEVSPQHVAQLQDYATRLTFGSEEKVQILINRIKCDHGAALLDQKTQVASAIPRAARL